MNKQILWIEDDYFAIQGLFRPVEKDGYKFDTAFTALDAYRKAQNWKNYDLIVVDLIIPISQGEIVPDIVKSWDDTEVYEYVGIGLIKWLMTEVQAKCPVVILSVVPDPIATYKIEDFGISGYIQKSGLLPSSLKIEISEFIKK